MKTAFRVSEVKRLLTLTPRLQMIAAMLPVGKSLADVGTDHAYLPVYAVANGICPSAFAGDINQGPLDNAKATVKKYGVSDKISLVLSPGLDNFPVRCADTVVIAGMGGEQIADIAAAASWLKSPDITLIVQPMTMHEKCRVSLADTGFKCIDTKYAKEGRHIYVAEKYAYSPPCGIDDVTAYIGYAAESNEPLAGEYLQSRIKKLRQMIAGMEKAESVPPEITAYKTLLKAISGIEKEA